MFSCSGLSFIAIKWEAEFLVAPLFFILQKFYKFEYFSIIHCNTLFKHPEASGCNVVPFSPVYTPAVL